MRVMGLAVLLALVGCKKKTPAGPVPDQQEKPEVTRIDDSSVLGRFLDTLADDARSRKVARPCRETNTRLGEQSRCVLDGFATRPPACDDGMSYLVARMVTRHFVCVPHTATETSAVFDSVMGFLESTGTHAARACPADFGWLGFSADVGPVLSTMGVFGADSSRIRKIARLWDTELKMLTPEQVTQMCAMATAG